MAPLDGFSRAYYRFKSGKMRARYLGEAPLRINLRQIYRRTAVGSFSKAISDWSHESFFR